MELTVLEINERKQTIGIRYLEYYATPLAITNIFIESGTIIKDVYKA